LLILHNTRCCKCRRKLGTTAIKPLTIDYISILNWFSGTCRKTTTCNDSIGWLIACLHCLLTHIWHKHATTYSYRHCPTELFIHFFTFVTFHFYLLISTLQRITLFYYLVQLVPKYFDIFIHLYYFAPLL